MAYSTIIKKKCKCGCDKYPTMSCGGYNYSCMPPELAEKVGTRRKAAQKAKNQRVALASRLRAVNREINGEGSLELWYMARRYEMNGVCSEPECGVNTNKDDNKWYRWSVCHIVPKALIKSVATNFLNWIELCQDHHGEYDKDFDKAAKMRCFPEIKRRFGLFQHLIPPDELRRVNPHLLTDVPQQPK